MIKIFIIPSSLFTILMLVISLYNIPQDMSHFETFKTQKIKEAKFIIQPNKLGQKFGDYFLFTNQKDKETLRNVTLFTQDKSMRLLLTAKTANIKNHKGVVQLNLHHGTGDTFLPEKIKTMTYDTMQIFSYIDSNSRQNKAQWHFQSILHHTKEMAWFIYYLFLSLSPLLVFGITISLAITNPRYQKAHPHVFSFLIILLVYLVASYLMRHGTPSMLLWIVALFILANVMLLKKHLFQRF